MLAPERLAAARTSLRKRSEKGHGERAGVAEALGMTTHRWRVALASLIAAATLGAASPAYAGTHGGDRCERKLERIERDFRVIERVFGWELASKWWNDIAWPHYYRQCGG